MATESGQGKEHSKERGKNQLKEERSKKGLVDNGHVIRDGKRREVRKEIEDLVPICWKAHEKHSGS